METANTKDVKVTERRMDVEFTVGEIQKLHVLAIRERSKTNDQDQEVVNLARKLLEYRRRAAA